jgi:hypothetical protein
MTIEDNLADAVGKVLELVNGLRAELADSENARISLEEENTQLKQEIQVFVSALRDNGVV